MNDRHLIVTRFAVPHPATPDTHRDPAWLERRHQLFRRFYVPSVARLDVEAVLLCGGAVAAAVGREVADLPWARVVVQDDWHGGLPSADGRLLTRLDSDDAVHAGWLAAVEQCPAEADVCVGRSFLRLDLERWRLYRYRRREPSPLAAFRPPHEPYRHDHKHLAAHYRTHDVGQPFLLQVAHRGNLSNRLPAPWRLDRRVPLARLAPYGVAPPALPGAADR
jgi:hypothetical protein